MRKLIKKYQSVCMAIIPDDGCITYPRYIGNEEVKNFYRGLISHAGILLPSSIYKSELLDSPKDRFRIGFGRKNIQQGLSVFREFIAK